MDSIDDEIGMAMSSEPDSFLNKVAAALFTEKTGPSSETGKGHSQDLSEYSNSNIWIPETFEI